MAEGKKVGFWLYSHYVWFAIALAILLPGIFWVMDVTMRGGVYFWWMNLLVLGLYLGLGSAVVHVSIWAVLGDRSIVKRTLASLAIALIVLAGFIAGYSVLLWSHQHSEFILMAQMGALLALPFIVAAQVPFWFLRGAFGWQLVREGEQAVAISLKQLFLITLVFGVAFAMPSIAAKVYKSTADASHLPIGSTHYETVLKEDGTYDFDEIEVTLENRAQLLDKQNQQMLQTINSSILSFSGSLAILSFLSIPVVWFVFRFRFAKAIFYSWLYGVLIFCLFGIGCVPFYGWTYFWIRTSTPAILGIAMAIISVAVPLLISKSKGFWLSTARVRPAVVEEKFEPVVDPLA